MKKINLVFGVLFGFALQLNAGVANDAIQASGINAGLFVHLGAKDGAIELEAIANGRFMSHSLCTDQASLLSFRTALMAQSKYGIASAEMVKNYSDLPYGDNLINLLVADYDALSSKGLRDSEVLRVLVPDGAAYLKKNGIWTITRKPRPATYGTWTHFFANSENTQASDDYALGITTTVKWTANHQWSTHFGETGSPTQYRVDKNIVYYVFQKEEPTRQYTLVARDAYNGITLWAKENVQGLGYDSKFRFCAAGGRLYYYNGVNGYAIAVDGRTGQTIREYTNGLKLVSKGSHGMPATLTVCNGKLIQSDGSDFTVLDLETGALNSKYKAPSNLWVMRVTASENEKKVFFLESGRPYFGGPDNNLINGRWPMVDSIVAITAFDLKNTSNTPLWRKDLPMNPAYDGCLVNDMTKAYAAHYPRAQQFAYYNGKLVLYANEYGDPCFVMVFDMNGNRVWSKEWVAHERNKAATVTYQMIVKNDSVFALTGGSMIAFNLHTGAHDSVPGYLTRSSPCYINKVWFNANHNGRCTRPVANQNFILMGFGMFVDRNRNWSFINAARSACAEGPMIGNGLAYYSTHNCGCLGKSLNGFQALGNEKSPSPIEDTDRKITDLPIKSLLTQNTINAGDILGKEWKLNWNNASYYGLDTVCSPTGGPAIGRPSTCVVGPGITKTINGYTFTLALNEHRVECRNGSGNLLWSFIADSRINQHPIIVNDLAIFGAHDGYVYAVKVADGTPIWKFLAAPSSKKMVAHGQVESCWPVFGVSNINNTIVVSAGRHAAMDGGIYVYGLDPVNASIKWKKVARAELLFYNYPITPKPNVPNVSFNTDSISSTGIDPNNPADKVYRTNQNTETGTSVSLLPPVAIAERKDNRNMQIHNKKNTISLVPVGYKGKSYIFKVNSKDAHSVSIHALNGALVFSSESQCSAVYELTNQVLKSGFYIIKVKDKAGNFISNKLTISF